MEEEVQFRHTFPVQLRFSDVDQLGHVNNSVYFSLYDLAKTTYFNDVMNRENKWHEAKIVVANIQASFLAPVFFRENIVIRTATVHLGNKSLTLMQQAVNADTNEVKCTCQTVMVGYDLESKSSQPISEEWKQAIKAFEQKEAI